ncbi:uncharacterized protein RHOBADRAFT_52359 [Rhodotorula graminis WP1]|uniref:Uncharacterized protein n=1 Tax=Rhodotorula graminis (strain WP1) TaxID=578459 RepID=A0A194S6W6_RHOGW|nr:uncharacterized protein RHOBADRAFT_52359 [Rhodotorula graminis WP1]KPV76337.1 hypothetical protein RHOBADRAFT_52359 [Rhodotorula graminis WP1]
MSDPDSPPVEVDTVLPPWIWLTLCSLSLVCLVFVSFRRAKSLELYERATTYLRRKLPFAAPPRAIHLSEHDLEAATRSPSSRPRARRSRASQDDLSDLSTGDDDDDDDDDDDLPPRSTRSPLLASSPTQAGSPFPTRRAYALDTRPALSLASSALSALQRTAGSASDALGWGSERGMRALRGDGERSDGIARAFWGVRKGDRAGGIRLGGAGGATPAGGASRWEDEEVEAGRGTEVREGARGSRGAGHSKTASGSSAALFDLGDDGDPGDAVELPHEFSLSSRGTAPH